MTPVSSAARQNLSTRHCIVKKIIKIIKTPPELRGKQQRAQIPAFTLVQPCEMQANGFCGHVFKHTWKLRRPLCCEKLGKISPRGLCSGSGSALTISTLSGPVLTPRLSLWLSELAPPLPPQQLQTLITH